MSKFKVLLGMLVAFMVMQAVFAKTDVMYVATEVVSVKAKSSLRGKQVGQLHYGDTVVVLKEKGNWVQIKSSKSSITGWVNSNTITRKKIVATNSQVSTNASELALAGKGFSAAVESEYSKTYNVSFDIVDAMENHAVSENATMTFIEKGQLFLGDE